jgi:hypothetical protein
MNSRCFPALFFLSCIGGTVGGRDAPEPHSQQAIDGLEAGGPSCSAVDGGPDRLEAHRPPA